MSKISDKVLLDPGQWWTRGECGLSRRTGGESRAGPCEENRKAIGQKDPAPIFLPEIDEYKASTWLVLPHCFTRLEPYMISSKPPLSYVGFSHIPMVKSPHLPVAHRGTSPSCRYLLPLSMQRPRWDEIPKRLRLFCSMTMPLWFGSTSPFRKGRTII